MNRSGLWLAMVIFGACGPSLTGRVSNTSLQICRTEDPIPKGEDDEHSLCLSVNLVALETGSYTLDGTAAWTDAIDMTTLAFTPGTGNSPRLTSALATATCYAPPSKAPASQQLTGTVRIDWVTATGVDGSVNVAVSGALPGPVCGYAAPTSLVGTFHLTR